MPLTTQQEAEIYPILDKAVELDAGKGILHRCTTRRADYLTRMIQGVRYDSAIESIEMYDPGHALYGLGLYPCLWVEPHDQGLLATLLPEPPESLMWSLIRCAATQEPVTLPNIAFNRARQRLARAQRKYPEIMNAVYISQVNGESTASYGVVALEEVLIVDIDVKPDTKLKTPSDRQVAQAKHPMLNPPRWK